MNSRPKSAIYSQANCSKSPTRGKEKAPGNQQTSLLPTPFRLLCKSVDFLGGRLFLKEPLSLGISKPLPAHFPITLSASRSQGLQDSFLWLGSVLSTEGSVGFQNWQGGLTLAMAISAICAHLFTQRTFIECQVHARSHSKRWGYNREPHWGQALPPGC